MRELPDLTAGLPPPGLVGGSHRLGAEPISSASRVASIFYTCILAKERCAMLTSATHLSLSPGLLRCNLVYFFMSLTVVVSAVLIQPALQPCSNSLRVIFPLWSVSTIVKFMTNGSALPFDRASPMGAAIFQAAWHCLSPRGAIGLVAACAVPPANTEPTPNKAATHVRVVSLIARTPEWFKKEGSFHCAANRGSRHGPLPSPCI